MQLDSIHIRNFRCLRELDLTRLSRINILVGRNNTGKSALLEATALASSSSASWYDALGYDILQEIIERRGDYRHADFLMTMGSERAEIISEGSDFSGIVNIVREANALPENARGILYESVDRYVEEAYNEEIDRITKSKRYEKKPHEVLIRNLERKITMARRDIMREVKLCIAGANNRSERVETAAVFAEVSEELLDSDFYKFIPEEEIIRSSEPRTSNTFFSFSPSEETLIELHGILTRSGQLAPLIRKLRKQIEYFEDIREVEEDLFVSIKNFSRPLPIGSMGDGFSATLALLTAIAVVEHGIIIMEEPEIRLHPGFMRVVADHIIETASNETAQYFISTHSSDFIELLLRAPADLITVVRMYGLRESAEIDYEVLNGREAKEEIADMKMDLRGP